MITAIAIDEIAVVTGLPRVDRQIAAGGRDAGRAARIRSGVAVASAVVAVLARVHHRVTATRQRAVAAARVGQGVAVASARVAWSFLLERLPSQTDPTAEILRLKGLNHV